MPKIKLSQIDTIPPKSLKKEKVKTELEKITKEISSLQNLLYASSQYSLLVILQGMDASGKDGTIKNVFSEVNPQGVEVHSFKVPTELELSHDFLWRIHQQTPPKGIIKIFNRSQYEDILVTRVHKNIDDATARKRMEAINNFEKLLTDNHTVILKFYLHISHEEQLKRLNERLNDPEKKWKYNGNDFKESVYWDEYRKVYEDAFNNCNDPEWTIVPADKNWYKEYIVATKVRDALKSLNLQYPEIKNI
ncbi:MULTISPECIES: PPK2 family polyphosphate kinase [Chitinophagaceae]